MRKHLNKLLTIVVTLTMLVPANPKVGATQKSTDQCNDTKEYIVLAKTKEKEEIINKKYKSFDCEYTEHSEENNISCNEMTKEEAKQLEKDKDVISVEENIELIGCSEEIDPDEIVEDWNLDMINADIKDESIANEKVKVAIIDSGIDECEGIEVKERYNLVPEEEEVLPIYDDFTGHGTAIIVFYKSYGQR